MTRDLPGVGDVLRANVSNVRDSAGTLAFTYDCPQCRKAIRVTSKTARAVGAVASTKRCTGCGTLWSTMPGTHWPAEDGYFESIKVQAQDTPFGRRGPATT